MLHIAKHPLIQHKLALLRADDISTKDFRELAAEISILLSYEATKDFALEDTKVTTWSGEIKAKQIAGKKITLVPILRAGLGMMDGVIKLLPSARISVVGFYRDEQSLKPVQYYAKLAPKINERTALVVDPMLATGGTFIACVDLLKRAGCKNIKGLFLVAAPEGVRALEKAHPDIDIYVAALDDKLDENGYILPGLGDAGDKLFGTK